MALKTIYSSQRIYTYNSSGQQNARLQFSCYEEKDEANLSSTVKYELRMTQMRDYYNTVITYNATIGDKTYSGSGSFYYDKAYHMVTYPLDVSYTKYYNSLDGYSDVMSIPFSIEIKNFGESGRVDILEGTIEFTPCSPQAITLLTAPNFSDEENPTITFTKPVEIPLVASYVASISFDGGTTEHITREIELASYDTSLTFNLTQAEKNLLYNNVTNGTTAPVTFKIRTEPIANSRGITTYNSLINKTFALLDAYPQANPTIEDVDAATLALTGNKNTLIKYFSDAAFSINAFASKGAKIVSQSITNGSKTVNGASGVIEDIESDTFTFEAVDSRGNAVSGTTTKNMVDYVKLTCQQKIDISLAGETGATANVVITGNHFRGSFGVVENNLILQIRHTQNDSTMGDWVTLTDFVEVYYNGNSYTADFSIKGLLYDIPYTFQCRAIDKLTEAVTAEFTTKVIPVFDWSANDFNFNVPVTFEGNTMVDMVIEEGTDSMGTNGTWYWRKWKSGKAECYGCRNYGNMGVSTAWGVLFRSETFTQSLPSGLFTSTPEVIDISLRGGSFGGFIARHESTSPSTNSTGSFIVCRPASATISQAFICFNIIGRWK